MDILFVVGVVILSVVLFVLSCYYITVFHRYLTLVERRDGSRRRARPYGALNGNLFKLFLFFKVLCEWVGSDGVFTGFCF